jgi:hypothetical protein
MLFADDRILMATSERQLQIMACSWQENTKLTYQELKQNQWQCMGTTYQEQITSK